MKPIDAIIIIVISLFVGFLTILMGYTKDTCLLLSANILIGLFLIHGIYGKAGVETEWKK